MHQHERDSGQREGLTSADKERIETLERKNRELRQANEILRNIGGARPPLQAMKAFIDAHRHLHGVEPICRALRVAPSTYYAHAARRADPELRSPREKKYQALAPEVEHVWSENFEVYGVRKVWRQLRRERFTVARCTVQRLMYKLGLRGVIRGKAVRTTVSDPKAPCPLDHVQRRFQADRPNALWFSDFTYVSTWRGFVYVAFVIDVFARRIVGWKASSSARTDFVLDALEQALHARRPVGPHRLVYHSGGFAIRQHSLHRAACRGGPGALSG